MKVNFAFLHGEMPNHDKDVVLNNLPSDWNIHVLKFFDEEIALRKDINQVYVFDDELFSRKLTDEEIAEAERWLGHSFFLCLQYYSNWWKGYNTDEKKLREYYELIARVVLYSRRFFTEHDINLFSMFVASRIPFVAAALTAKKLQIKPAIFAEGGLSHHFVLYDYDFNPIFWKGVTKDDIRNAKAFFSGKFNKKNKNQELPEVAEKNRRYFNLANCIIGNSRRLYRRMNRKNKSLLPPYKPVFSEIGSVLTSQTRKFIVPLLLDRPDFSKRFLFFPMHFDAETHLTWREHFINQWDLMRKVAECLPIRTYLYTKPHPNWLCTEVVISELMKLKKQKNIRVLYPSVSPVELVSHAQAIITINSTTGLEAIALGKPLITFGHNFYAREDVSIPVRDLKELPDAIEKVLHSPARSYKQEEREKFLAQYYINLIPITQPSTFLHALSESDGRNIAKEIANYAEYALKHPKTSR